jgi:anti-sigma regulatory factor (Ser/Thr protein kinase)
MSATGRFVGRKIVNDKRGNLTRDLIASFRRQLLLRRLLGARPPRGILHLIGHHRYGTSSAPSVAETHWHRWLRPRRLPTWGIEERTLVRRGRVVENLITHNGDFLTWQAPWGSLTVGVLGGWLAEVLGERHPAHGDSPKIAGMLDLLNTQGRWGASLRLAFAMQRRITPPKWYLKELTRIAEQVFALNEPTAVRKSLSLHVELEEGLTARADSQALREILDNLVSNAVKYNRPGGSVDLQGFTRDGTVVLRVRDEGPGFQESDFDRLFQPFVRLSASPSAGESSTGLGLSIVKELTEAMAGQVAARNRRDRGAEIEVMLPRADPDTGAAAEDRQDRLSPLGLAGD